VEELVLEALFGWLGRERCAAGGGGDDGEELHLRDGGAGDEEALGVGAGVRRGKEDAGVVDQRVEQGDVGGGEAFEEVAGAEGDPEPEALCAGAGEEGASGEAFGVGGVAQVEVADIADGFDVGERERENAAAEVEEVEDAVVGESGVGKIAREGVSGEAADDDLFARVGRGWRHGRMRGNEGSGAIVARHGRCVTKKAQIC